MIDEIKIEDKIKKESYEGRDKKKKIKKKGQMKHNIKIEDEKED